MHRLVGVFSTTVYLFLCTNVASHCHQVAALTPDQLLEVVREHISDAALRAHLHVAIGRIVAAQAYKKVASFLPPPFFG